MLTPNAEPWHPLYAADDSSAARCSSLKSLLEMMESRGFRVGAARATAAVASRRNFMVEDMNEDEDEAEDGVEDGGMGEAI
jgi:hypothetical protein